MFTLFCPAAVLGVAASNTVSSRGWFLSLMLCFYSVFALGIRPQVSTHSTDIGHCQSVRNSITKLPIRLLN